MTICKLGYTESAILYARDIWIEAVIAAKWPTATKYNLTLQQVRELQEDRHGLDTDSLLADIRDSGAIGEAVEDDEWMTDFSYHGEIIRLSDLSEEAEAYIESSNGDIELTVENIAFHTFCMDVNKELELIAKHGLQ